LVLYILRRHQQTSRHGLPRSRRCRVRLREWLGVYRTCRALVSSQGRPATSLTLESIPVAFCPFCPSCYLIVFSSCLYRICDILLLLFGMCVTLSSFHQILSLPICSSFTLT
jgi:hypothetical protein